MTIEEKRAALEAHPDTVRITIAGRAYPWNLGGWAKRLAEAEDIPVADQVAALSTEVDEADPVAGMFRLEQALANLLMAGLMPFADSADDARDLVDLMGPSDILRHSGTIRRAMSPRGLEGKAPGETTADG